MMPVKDSISQLSISLADVAAARERVREAIYYSPCPHSQMLSALTGQQVYLKLENLQMTGSFKERGALNRLALLTPEQAARGWSLPARGTMHRALPIMRRSGGFVR
ncbi:pyridoxal-phosphate dependent enzyme [Tunturiibacter empetritectus]|uniref:pyridoxal-phosphate dependent enzyme n=1 Tax=Tunturiibacter empetritectus TaxID=3069691 RepID=UPI003D9B0594